MRVRAATLAMLLLLAGCSVGYTPSAESPDTTEQIGVEDGYRYDATLAVTPADGYNQTELSAVVARTIARVERLREVEFDAMPEVVLQSRAEYRAQNRSFTRDPGRAGNARWEAAFMIGEDADAGRVVDSLFGGAVAGYYLPGSDRIVLVSKTGETVDTRTLAHELVHALQDARGWHVAGRDTFDGRLAATGLTEGEATAVARAYADRCGDAWTCLPRAGGGASNASAIAAHPGVYLTFRAPYVAGAAFVDRLRDRGGWQAVTAAYDRPPASTRELLVADTYPADVPLLTVADRSGEAWERYATPDSLGRATVHALFWANGLVNRGDDAIRTDYEDPYSAGLVTDRFVPYRNGTADGYVWRLRFENASEAREFVDGYERLLLVRQRADRVRERVYVVRSGPFADAFRVTRDSDTVTVVNGPTVADLDRIHG
jgi:hypothetical protein